MQAAIDGYLLFIKSTGRVMLDKLAKRVASIISRWFFFFPSLGLLIVGSVIWAGSR